MPRVKQLILIVATLLGSWFAMQAIHELGHVLAARVSGGHVAYVELHPLKISRTEVDLNPHPLFVVWCGPMFGVIAPLVIWAVFVGLKMPGRFIARFFAGFCLVANGLYIWLGSFNRIGDCREMLQHGSQEWQLWLFGVIAVPLGFLLWNGQGKYFGLRKGLYAVSKDNGSFRHRR